VRVRARAIPGKDFAFDDGSGGHKFQYI
jgi:hypothetical protein